MNVICTNYPECNHRGCYAAAIEQSFNKLSHAREMKYRKMLDSINKAATQAVKNAVEAQDKVLVDRKALKIVINMAEILEDPWEWQEEAIKDIKEALKGGSDA